MRCPLPIRIFCDLSAWILITLVVTATTFAQASVPANTLSESVPVSMATTFQYIEDPSESLGFEEIRGLSDDKWKDTETGGASFGFSDSQYWFRLKVVNRKTQTENYVAEISYPQLDDVSFFSVKQNGELRSIDTGDNRSFFPRDVLHPNQLFRFQLAGGEDIHLYARIRTNGSMIVPLRLWQENKFFEFASKEQKFHFFYYGCLSVIILINFAIFLTLREKLYLFYSLSTSGYLLFFLTSRGYGLQLFFPDTPALNSQLFLSSMPILALFSLLFAREFLKTNQHSPKMDLAIRGMIYFEYFNMVAAIVLDYNVAVKISAVSALVLFAVLFCAGPVSWYAKQRAGVFFTVAWMPLTIGFAVNAMRSSGALPNNFLTEYAMQIGSGLEAFILSLALAERLYREREEKIRAQATSIQTEKQRLAAQNQLSEALMRDPVTNLANRNRFELLVNDSIRENPDEEYVICVSRVTRVNEITRTLGLGSVERIFRLIGERMDHSVCKVPGIVTTENSTGSTSAAFQLAGDTFGVLVVKSIFESNLDQYQTFIHRLSMPIEMDSLSIELGPLVGCAFYPEHGRDAAQLIRNALVAMESSNHASDQIGYYDHTLDIYNESRLTLMSDLRDALSNDGVTLHYQPKLDLKTSEVVGLEALMRWQHPERGFVSPADFIPLAEQTGVIRQLTLWALERAARDLRTLRAEGYEGNMAVNISAKDLLSENLVQQISEILERYDVDPSKLYLELTETSAMEEPEAGLKALNELTSLGLKISIDDFGAGYSSLSYLKQLPASEIKLDRSLIVDITQNESSSLIVKASVDMVHGLGYSVVAEGVEDQKTCQALKDIQCDTLQGFWFCKPKPLEELQTWLSDKV